MAVTSNMSISLINASDYVNPDTINDAFTVLDALGLDYIVASGTSGDWWYRKWKSGRAECGIDSKQFAQQTFSQWGNITSLYHTPRLSFGNYPITFAAKPFACVTFGYDTESTGRGSYISQCNSNSTTTSPSFYVMDCSSGTITPACGIYVSGSWK